MNQIDKLVDAVESMRDDLDKALIVRSDSITPSFSVIITEMKKDIADIKEGQRRHVETHIAMDAKNEVFTEEQRRMNARIEPYIKKAEDDREFAAGLEARGKKFGFWAGIWMSVSLVIGSIYYGLKHIK